MSQVGGVAEAFLRGLRVFLDEDRAEDIELIRVWVQEPGNVFVLYQYRAGPSDVFGWSAPLPATEGLEAALLSGMDAAQELSEPLGSATIKADENGVRWSGPGPMPSSGLPTELRAVRPPTSGH